MSGYGAVAMDPVDRTVKQLELNQLLRSALPLIAAGLGLAGLYISLAVLGWACVVAGALIPPYAYA